MKKSDKSKGFLYFIITYSVFLVLLIVVGLIYVWNLLIDYEASIPDVNMERELALFEQENIANLLSQYPVEINEYDSYDYVVDEYVKKAGSGKLSYKKLTGEYTNTTPVYEILAGDKAIAKLKFAENGKNGHGFSVWKVQDISFDEYKPSTYDVSFKVPATAGVLVNGAIISEDYRVEGDDKVPLTGNISDYVKNVPEYKYYEINDLFGKLSINIEGDHIVEVSDPDYTFSYEYGTDEELKNQVSGRIMAMAREYGAYIINKGNLGLLKSYMVGKAREYVSDIPAVWAYLYGEEYTFSYTEEVIENFVKYSDDCFSCDVSFKLNVVYRGSRGISYDTALSCMYVKIDGQWYLADFALK